MTSIEVSERRPVSAIPFALARLAVLIACLAAVGVYQASGFVHQDPSFMLVAVERWLRGAVLYRDIMETNPPLIFYWTAPAVIASEHLNIDANAAFVATICIVVFISLLWCWRLLGRASGVTESTRYFVIVACFAALMITPAYQFGQREHLFIATALPYFLAKILGPMGLRLSTMEKILIGFFSFWGFALKPYFFIPAASTSAMVAWQERKFRPLYDADNVVLALGSVAYVIFVAVRHPDYFSVIAPMVLNIYTFMEVNPLGVIETSEIPLLSIIAIATLGDTSPQIRRMFAILSAVLAGLLAAYVLQRKGWDYHLLPFDSMALVACFMAVAASSHSAKSRPLHFTLFAVLPLVLLVRAVTFPHYENAYTGVFSEKLREINPDWHGKSLIVLAGEMHVSFPLLNEIGADWVGRYQIQWVVAGATMLTEKKQCAYNPALCAKARGYLEYGRRTNVDDFVAHEPDAVIVDDRPLKMFFPENETFDYIEFLKGDPRFPEIWSHYKKVDSALGYDIWVRAS